MAYEMTTEAFMEVSDTFSILSFDGDLGMDMDVVRKFLDEHGAGWYYVLDETSMALELITDVQLLVNQESHP